MVIVLAITEALVDYIRGVQVQGMLKYFSFGEGVFGSTSKEAAGSRGD